MRFAQKSDYISAVSMGASIAGPTIDLDQMYGYTYQAVWTGTPTGNVIHQASNDGVTWFDLDTQAAGGAAGSKLFEKNGAFYRYTRLIYTRVGGTGSLTVNAVMKG